MLFLIPVMFLATFKSIDAAHFLRGKFKIKDRDVLFLMV